MGATFTIAFLNLATTKWDLTSPPNISADKYVGCRVTIKGDPTSVTYAEILNKVTFPPPMDPFPSEGTTGVIGPIAPGEETTFSMFFGYNPVLGTYGLRLSLWWGFTSPNTLLDTKNYTYTVSAAPAPPPPGGALYLQYLNALNAATTVAVLDSIYTNMTADYTANRLTKVEYDYLKELYTTLKAGYGAGFDISSIVPVITMMITMMIVVMMVKMMGKMGEKTPLKRIEV